MTGGPRAAAYRGALEAGMTEAEARSFAAYYPAVETDDLELLIDDDTALLRGSCVEVYARIMEYAADYLESLADPGVGTK